MPPKPRTPKTAGGQQAKLWSERERLIPAGSAVYTRVVIERAQNARIRDVDGKEYIDFAGGIGALNVGHCHPKVTEAVREQAGKLIHTSFHVASYPGYVEAARLLVEAFPGPGDKKALFFNSGAEAVENAIKLAKAHTRRRGVICFTNAFHGRTLLCMTLDGKFKPLRQGFGPAPADVYRSLYPYPYRPPRGVDPRELTEHCLERLEQLFVSDAAPEDVAAIVAEPVLGEGGFVVPSPGFLPGLRRLCDRHGIVLVIDEVQTGFGRTGMMFGCEHENVVGDLLVVGKSLAAGLPLSGVVGKAAILDSAPVGSVGGTYGGNPLACAAAIATFEIFREERLVERSRRIGRLVQERFDALKERIPIVGDSRGLGAMRAIELVKDRKTKEPLPAKPVLHACEEHGLIALKAGPHDNVIRTLMPLTISDDELARGLDILEEALKSVS